MPVDTLTEYLAKNANRFNIRDFGAIGDGVTDDTDAIAAARDAARAYRKPLYIPTGDFLILEPLDVTDCSVIGDGLQSIIFAYPSAGVCG